MSWILRMIPGHTPAVSRADRRTGPKSVGRHRGARAEQIRAWSNWFGLRRLIGSAIAMVIVCAGAYWLVRTPPPPTEALLPRAATTTSAPSIPTATDLVSIPPVVSPPVATSPPIAVVHVAGAVVSSGVYRVDAGARVDEAIRLAGGPTPDADIDVMNLAAIVVDGSRIYVPRVGEPIPPDGRCRRDRALQDRAGPARLPPRAPRSWTSTTPRSTRSTNSRAWGRPRPRRSLPSANATVRSSASMTSIGCPASGRPSSMPCAIW